MREHFTAWQHGIVLGGSKSRYVHFWQQIQSMPEANCQCSYERYRISSIRYKRTPKKYQTHFIQLQKRPHDDDPSQSHAMFLPRASMPFQVSNNAAKPHPQTPAPKSPGINQSMPTANQPTLPHPLTHTSSRAGHPLSQSPPATATAAAAAAAAAPHKAAPRAPAPPDCPGPRTRRPSGRPAAAARPRLARCLLLPAVFRLALRGSWRRRSLRT